jgi:HPr kinase/phosphorylase
MPHRVTIQQLYDALRERLQLSWLAGQGGSERSLLGDLDQSARRIIAGPLNFIHPHRVQVVGPSETEYLDSLDPRARQDAIHRLFSANPAAVVLVEGVASPDDLAQAADASDTPLLASPLPDNQVLDNLQYYGSLVLADKTTIHGVFMEVLGMGVLLVGDAAVGKSELALELVARGGRLVADDAPEFTRIAPDIVNGTCPPLLREFLEVRGLGILNIRAMFGDSAIKRSKYLRLIVQLKRMNQQELAELDRLAGTSDHRDVLGVAIPEVTVPVAPGRNLGILVEAAVRNHMLKLQGYDASSAFIERQQQAIKNDG